MSLKEVPWSRPIVLSLLCILLLSVPGCGVKCSNLTSAQVQSLSSPADAYQNQRSQMVQQLHEHGIQDRAEHAPYDGIIVTAAPDYIPQALINQLVLNSRLVIPVGMQNQEMLVITKTQDHLIEQTTIPVRFVPITGTLGG